MATLRLTLDKRRAKNDGTYLLVFRISIGCKIGLIKSGYHASVEKMAKCHQKHFVIGFLKLHLCVELSC